MSTVLDWSFVNLTPAQVKQAGAIGAIRYVGDFTSSKVIDKPEYDALLAAGLEVALVCEFSALDWQKGYNTGKVFGVAARSHARQLGFPDERPIYVAVDSDVSQAELPTALEHVRGFRDGNGTGLPQGVYGTCFLIGEALIRGYISVGWQSMSTGFFGNSGVCPHAAARQLPPSQQPSSAFDVNTVLKPDWGQVRRLSLIEIAQVVKGIVDGIT